MFGQCVMAAPAASGPVFGATAPILIGSAACAAPIAKVPANTAAIAAFNAVLRITSVSSQVAVDSVRRVSGG
jgi:hypothetical protein